MACCTSTPLNFVPFWYIPLYGYITYILFISWWGCFHSLAVMNSALWLFMYTFLCGCVLISRDHIPRSGISESWTLCLTLCLTLWGPAWLFSKVATPFSFLWTIYGVSNFSTFLPALILICLFYLLAILVSLKRYLIVVLTWISLTRNAFEHLSHILR